MLHPSRLLAILALLFLPCATSAATITWTFSSDLPNGVGGPAAGSTTADVILTFDSATPDLDGSGTVGVYAVESAQVAYENGHVSAVSNLGVLTITVGLGIVWDQQTAASNFGIQGSGGFPATDALLTSGVGPVIPLVVSFLTTDDIGLVAAFPNTLTIVPEPALAALLLFGAFAACAGPRVGRR